MCLTSLVMSSPDDGGAVPAALAAAAARLAPVGMPVIGDGGPPSSIATVGSRSANTDSEPTGASSRRGTCMRDE